MDKPDTFGLLIQDNNDFISFKADLFPHTLQTPLHDAAFRGSIEEIKSLIEIGEDINSIDEHGHTPLRFGLVWFIFHKRINIHLLQM